MSLYLNLDLHHLIDELAELRGLFNELADSNDGKLRFAAFCSFCIEKCRAEEISNETLATIWSGVNHGNGTNPIDFEQFLQFLAYCDAQSFEHLVAVKSNPSELADQIKSTCVIASTDRTPNEKSLRSLLTIHLRKRPDSEALKSRGILHMRPQPVEDLEKAFKKTQLKSHLTRRPSVEDMQNSGLCPSSMEVNTHQLELNMAKDHLEKKLNNRPDFQELKSHGIALPLTPQQAHLEKQLIQDSLKHALQTQTRPDLHDLENRGIVRRCSNAAIHTFTTSSLLNVERSLLRCRLQRALTNPRRPSITDLKNHGIMLDQTPLAHQLEKDLKKNDLKHKLQTKPSPEDLTNMGILLQ